MVDSTPSRTKFEWATNDFLPCLALATTGAMDLAVWVAGPPMLIQIFRIALKPATTFSTQMPSPLMLPTPQPLASKYWGQSPRFLPENFPKTGGTVSGASIWNKHLGLPSQPLRCLMATNGMPTIFYLKKD